MSKYAMPPTATSTFPKNGDAGPEVVNASGQPSPYMQSVGRRAGGPTTPDTGGDDKSNRRPVMIDAESGQAQADATEKALRRAAKHLSLGPAVEGCDSHTRATYLDHVFGLNVGR